ncbi:MAG: hypothetical protein R3B06_12760 [Kofleriaceae bacterium]
MRAAAVAANDHGLKVHLRLIAVGGVTYRVVSPRPASAARFSTNLFHDTWHILTGCAGAALMGRLVWGLAYQRQADTLVVIDGPHVVATPFEADPGDPIAIIPAGLTRFEVAHLAEVRRRMARVAPTTIRWHTFGLSGALARDRHRHRHRRPTAADASRERMSRAAGMVCFTAPAGLLREVGADIYRCREATAMTYLPLADRARSRCRPDGEVQVFPTFDEDVAAAIVARREALGATATNQLTDEARRVVWRQREVVAARRQRNRAHGS